MALTELYSYKKNSENIDTYPGIFRTRLTNDLRLILKHIYERKHG
jgi:hypothetical protein